MNPFLKYLEDGVVLIADGATGTNLQKMGLNAGAIPEELVLDQPELLISLASKFVEAGSDIILTCTFGGTSLRMKDSLYVDRVSEINTRAVELAREATLRREGVLVAGSIGPTGLLLQPYGPLSAEDTQAAYTVQAESLYRGGVDLLVIETMFSMEEAALAFDAARSVSDLPIVVSFSYDRGTRKMMGVRPTQVIKVFAEKGAAVMGCNAEIRAHATSLPSSCSHPLNNLLHGMGSPIPSRR